MMRLVRESISFHRGGNPRGTLGIGLYKKILDEMLEEVREDEYWNKYGESTYELLYWSVSRGKTEYAKYLLEEFSEELREDLSIDDHSLLRISIRLISPEIFKALLHAGASMRVAREELRREIGDKKAAYEEFKREKRERNRLIK